MSNLLPQSPERQPQMIPAIKSRLERVTMSEFFMDAALQSITRSKQALVEKLPAPKPVLDFVMNVEPSVAPVATPVEARDIAPASVVANVVPDAERAQRIASAQELTNSAYNTQEQSNYEGDYGLAA